MNLLSLLLKGLASENSVSAASKKSGVSSKITSKLLLMAIPMLISYMTKNASKKEGAQSLLGALSQHTSKESIENQIANADTIDGSKIIGHILGKDQNSILNSLSKESGASVEEVSSVLNSIAPALLNSLSTVNSGIKNNNGKIDLSDGIGVDDVMALLNSGKKEDNLAGNALGLINNLIGNNAKENQNSSVNGLLNGLLNAESNASSNGVDLLSLLANPK